MVLRLASNIPNDSKIALQKKTLRDLTIGQVLALLSVVGTAAAAAIAGELTAQGGRTRPDDFCTIAMLGLVRVDRSGRYLTDKGLIWSDQVIGD